MGTEGQPETFSTTYVFLRLQPRGAFAARDPTDSSGHWAYIATSARWAPAAWRFQGIASLLQGVTTGSPLPAAGQRGIASMREAVVAPCSQWSQSPVSPLIFQTPVTVYFIYTRDTHILGTVGTRNKTKHLKWGQNWGQTGDRPGTSFALPPVAPCPTG